MKRFRRRTGLMLPLILLFLLMGQAFAGLKNVGPTDPVTTLPKYYLDTNNLALELCLDQNGMCLLGPPFDPAGVPPISPITTTGPVNDANFPDESFYYSAAALLPIEGGELANLAFVLEAAFLSGVVPEGGITFLRTDLQKMRDLTPNSTYRVTHPYGTFTFTTDAVGDTTGGGGVAIRLEDGPAVPVQWLPPGMKAATNTGIGPFLVPASGVFPTAIVNGETHTYVGDGTPVPITGSPTGNNFYRIERLDASGNPVPGAVWQTNEFALNGRIYTGPIPSELSFTATYARNETSGQIDIFATAQPGAVLTLSGSGILPTTLQPAIPEIGKYFLHIPVGSSILPTGLTMTNSLDLQSTPPRPVNLVDEIIIFKALYNHVSRELIITAQSRDKAAPPVLSVSGFTGSTLDAAGNVVLTLPVGAIPPATVQVVSSYGGSATAPVSVIIPPPAPTANDDTAATAKNSAVSVKVLANDVSQAGVDASTVTVVDQPASGATALSDASGAITYTPTASFAGTETFTYTVKDVYGQISNTASVTVTVHEPPTAGSDTASAGAGTTISIDVIANDTATGSSINSTTVNIVSPATCGSTAVLSNGTVDFTAPASVPAGDGTCSFSYTVSDTFVPSALSNVANVTITINPPPAAVDGLTIFSSLPSPQLSGTVVTFDAVATGGSGNYEYQYWLKDTSLNYTLVKPYSAPSTWSWDTAGLPTAGVYQIAVQARNVGSTVSFEQERVMNFSLNAPSGQGVAVGVTPSIPSPQTIGSPVFFAATVTGGTGTYEYQFWLKDTLGVYTLVQPYSLNSSWKWETTGVLPGGYTLAVQARVVGSAANFDAETTEVYFINAAPTAASSVSYSTNLTSPQTAGAQVFFTAAAGGGSGNYEYRFWLKDTLGNYSLAQPFSSGAIWKWDTTGLSAGTYTVAVQAKVSGSSNVFDAETTGEFVINAPAGPPAAATSVTLTGNLTSPQAAGTQLYFTAAAGGGSGSYEYQFKLTDTLANTTVVQAFSAGAIWHWDTTGLPAGTYTVTAQARSVGSVNPVDIETIGDFTISAPVGPPPAATSILLATNLTTPQTVGAQVFFTATAGGGSGSYEYQFKLTDTLANTTVVQAFSAGPIWHWDTTGLPDGTYTVTAQARSVGSVNPVDIETTGEFVINAPPAPPAAANAVNILTNLASPQTAGSQIFVTGEASGGSGSYEYQFKLTDPLINTTVVQAFSSGAIWHWDTTGLIPGTYTLTVQARSVGSVNVFDVEGNASFDIQVP